MKIYIERVKLSLLEMACAYENGNMLPQNAESFQKSGSFIPLYVIEKTLKELSAEGLIDGTEIGDKSYIVTGITKGGREKLKLSDKIAPHLLFP